MRTIKGVSPGARFMRRVLAMNEKLPPSTGPLDMSDLPDATTNFPPLEDHEWQMPPEELEFWRERDIEPSTYRSVREMR